MCVGRCKRLLFYCFVRWWRTERSLLFRPHPGIGPSQSAQGVWPGERCGEREEVTRRGGVLFGFAERGVLVERKEKL